MSARLEEQIRRYTEAIDAIAPPVEDLLPPDLANELDVEQRPGRVQVRLMERPPSRVPVWAIAVAAAAAVVLLFLPVWFWLSQPDGEVVATTTTVADEEPPPAVLGEPSVRVDLNGESIEGAGWTPGTEVSIVLAGGRVAEAAFTAVTDDDGRFRVSGFVDGFDGTLTVTDGDVTLARRVDYSFTPTRVDPLQDVIAGNAPAPSPGDRILVRVLGPDVRYETSIESAPAWMVDLTGEFDLMAGMTVEARLLDGDPVTVSWSSGMLVTPFFQVFDDGGLTGSGWSVSAPVRFSVNGVEARESVLTDLSGSFHTSASVLGFRFETGDVLTVEDGRTVFEVAIVPIEIETFDPDAGIASGTADVPDGTTISLDGWPTMASDSVTGGRWKIEFETVPGSPVSGDWWIAVEVAGIGWVAVAAGG